MKIKRYFAADMRQALQMVRDEQGLDAVILSNRKVAGGVEIVAAMDYDPEVVERLARQEVAKKPAASSSPASSNLVGPPAPKRMQSEASPAESKTAYGVYSSSHSEERGSHRPSEAEKVVWAQDPSIVAVREEIKTLRSLLETQLSAFAWNDAKARQPLRAQLLERLTRLGLAPPLARELADQVQFEDDPEHNWRQALGQLAHRVSVTNDDILTEGGVVALVGPTGVGKTTTVAKLAARYVLRHGPNRIALITTDNFRIGAQQQLRTYGHILGAPVFVAEEADELSRILEAQRDKSLILIDTTGTSHRDARMAEQLAMLKGTHVPVRTYAVLSSTSQRMIIDETLRAFSNARLAGCILTKLDETTSLGEILSAVTQHRIPVSYITNGQRVPEDLQPAMANNLVARSVALVKRAEPPSDETMAFSFGNMVSGAHG